MTILIKIFIHNIQFYTLALGRRTMMMSPMEFYSSVTPDCKTIHGVGSGAHVKVTKEEIEAGKVIFPLCDMTKDPYVDLRGPFRTLYRRSTNGTFKLIQIVGLNPRTTKENYF